MDPRPGNWIEINPRQNSVWVAKYSSLKLSVFSKDSVSVKIPKEITPAGLAEVKRAEELGVLKVLTRKPAASGVDEQKKDISLVDHLDNTITKIKKMVADGRFSIADIENLLSAELKNEKPRKSLVNFLYKYIKDSGVSELAIGRWGGGKEGMYKEFKRKKEDEPEDKTMRDELKENAIEKKKFDEIAKAMRNLREE